MCSHFQYGNLLAFCENWFLGVFWGFLCYKLLFNLIFKLIILVYMKNHVILHFDFIRGALAIFHDFSRITLLETTMLSAVETVVVFCFLFWWAGWFLKILIYFNWTNNLVYNVNDGVCHTSTWVQTYRYTCVLHQILPPPLHLSLWVCPIIQEIELSQKKS